MASDECYPIEDKPFASDDAVLDYTLSVRKNLVKRMTIDGTVPNDPDQQRVLLQTLQGMDSVALGRKKIKADEKTGNGLAALGGAMASLLQQANDPTLFQGRTIDHKATVKTLPAEIPDPVLVEGETSELPATLNYDSFMADPAEG